MYNFKKLYLILLVGLFASVILNIFTIKTFDGYSDYYGDKQHRIIKADAEKFYSKANAIKNKIDYDLEYREPFLPPRIIAYFYKIIQNELYDKFVKQDEVEQNNYNIVKNGNGKLIFFILQSIFYYSSLLFFLKKLSNIFDYKIILITGLFLSFEPTILFYHSSFWSESIFISLLLIIFGFIINISDKFFSYFILGLLIGLLYLQRSVAIYFFILITLFILFNSKKKIYLTSIFITGYLIVIILLGVSNYKRSGVFYVTSTQAKDGFWMYLIPNLISKKDKIDTHIAENILEDKLKIWKSENNIDENDLKSEKVRLKMYDFQQKESLKIILSNIDVSVKVIFKKTLHFLVFDPLGHTYFFHKHDYKTPLSIGYYRSEDHKKFIIPRIIYSLLIYSICLVGFFSSLKIRDKKYLYLLLGSIIYFTLVQSWIGNNRYAAPNLIFMSVFFSFGFCELIKLKKFIK